MHVHLQALVLDGLSEVDIDMTVWQSCCTWYWYWYLSCT